ncbi:PilZ domain-containing protein [Anaeromyxobacter sp. PSR-1]|uniref:PilZ domain-containing protein n=1 Tax=unclassified Anaeromyxobacter TaxID=2620896 RepID=UPI0005E510E6|nr:PilZ domain-containing protein [Anaeromyxobacter sp. PSR-1]GAO01862.1 pilZ domain protein [Anaeromyxobacter sp. PSR-1]
MLWSRREARKVVAAAGPDRRAAPRLDKVFRVYLEGDTGCGLGIARNISEGGMFVETRSPQPIGSQVRITFPSENGDMIAVAEVRYVCHLLGRGATAGGPLTMRGMGMRFLYFELDEAVPSLLQ